MTPYIILMTFGSILLALGLGVASYFTFTRRRAAHLLRLIGRSSEDQINADLGRWAKAHQAHFIKSALFSYGEDKLFEVDSILITPQAVIVVEIKSFSGAIMGRANDDTWVKIINDQRFPVTNALKQNDRHIRHIQAMINLKLPIISLIIYANRADSVTVPDVPQYALVIKHAQLYTTLDELSTSMPARISREQIRHNYHQFKKHLTRRRKDVNRFNVITQQVR